MLIKFEAEEELVDKLKEATNSAVASKAFHYAAIKYLDLKAELAEANKAKFELRQQIAGYKQVIEAARDAAKQLIERVNQEDLFTDQPNYDPDAWNDPD